MTEQVSGAASLVMQDAVTQIEAARAGLGIHVEEDSAKLAELGILPTEEQQEPAAEAEVQHEAESEESMEAEEPEAEAELFPELPEELQELLEMPDEEEIELPAAEESQEYEDYDLDALRKRALAAEKKAKYLEGLRLKDQRRNWEAEALKYFPLSDPQTIQAVSRRGFLREAKMQHERYKPIYDKLRKQAQVEIEREREKVLAEAKEKAATAWGRPTVGPSPVRPVESDFQSDIEKARRSGDLAKVIATLRKHGR